MIRFPLTRERKYVLLIGAVLLFFGFVYRIFPFFQGFYEGSDQINAKQKQLEKYQRILGQEKQLKGRLSALSKSLKRGESKFLSGRTPSLAAVDMQNILNRITSKSGVDIKSVRVLKAVKQEDERYLSIPVKFSIISTLRHLKEVLYGIEASGKFLTVRAMSINVSSRKNRALLRVEMTVAGFMKAVVK